MSQTEAPRVVHEPFVSIEAMLSVEAMSALEGRKVTDVRQRPWTPPYGVSGSQFLAVETSESGRDSRCYVVKRTTPSSDFVMRLTGDTACRERLIWQHGLLDRLPPEVSSPIVASARDGEGWALLMHDISSDIVPLVYGPPEPPRPPGQPLDGTGALAVLDAAAAMHAQFFEDPRLQDPQLGLLSARQFYSSFTPAAARDEPLRSHGYGEVVRSGWALLEQHVPGDVASAVREVLDDPEPLCAALAQYPVTLVHGDLRGDNFGLSRGSPTRLTLLDWQFVGAHPPGVELVYIISSSPGLMPLSREAVIDSYRAALARRLGDRFDDRWWIPQLELALLGQFLRSGWLWPHVDTTDPRPAARQLWGDMLRWWIEPLRAGLRRL